MPIIKTTCKNPKCNASVLSDTDKWNTAKEIISIVCPRCKYPIEKHFNPNYIKKGKTEFIPNPSFSKSSNSGNNCKGWLIAKGSKKYYELKLGRQAVGRQSSNKQSDVSIESTDLTISGAHCIIEASQNASGLIEFTITDNKSKNGIIINQKRKLLESEIIFLRHEDSILMGKTEFIFLSANNIKTMDELSSWIKSNFKL